MNRGDFWYMEFDWVNSNAKWLDLFLTLIAIVVAGWLLYETHKQVIISQDALEHEKTQDSLGGVSQRKRDSLAAEVARFDVRAYVVCTDIRMELLNTHAKFTADVTLKNVGKTPAYDLVCISHIQFMPISQKVFTPDGGKPTVPPSTITLGYGIPAPIPIVYPKIFSQEQVDAIINGTELIFVSGSATYTDVWGKPHHTNFCSYLNFLRGDWVAYDKYNDAN